MHTLYRLGLAMLLFLQSSATAGELHSPPLDITLKADTKDGTVRVVFFNPEPIPLRLWNGGNSWAMDNVRFILIRDKIVYYYREDPTQGFTRNFPGYKWVYEKESLEVEFHPFEKGKGWVTSTNAPSKLLKGDILICAYAVNPTPESTQYGVWVGTATGIIVVGDPPVLSALIIGLSAVILLISWFLYSRHVTRNPQSTHGTLLKWAMKKSSFEFPGR